MSRLSKKTRASTASELIRVTVRLSQTAEFSGTFPSSATLKRIKGKAETHFGVRDLEGYHYELRFRGEIYPEGMRLDQFRKADLEFELKVRSPRGRFGEGLFLR